MPIVETGEIVRVPFPYTDRQTRQRRPALIVSRSGWRDEQRLIWVLMITSAENQAWPDDIEFGPSYGAAGLPVPSVVRFSKIATMEAGHATALGHAPETVTARLRHALAL